MATYDHPLPGGWHHLAAVREGGRLRIVLDGKTVAESTGFNAQDFDLTNDQPLRIGFGAHDYFNGLMSDLRIYNRALEAREISALADRSS